MEMEMEMETKQTIKQNLKNVWQQIEAARIKSGRSNDEICLIAVSKTRPVSEIACAYEEGQLDFGENKPQEIRDKSPMLPQQIRWHMIGHLQSNKVKYVVGSCALIHSVDTTALARQIQEVAIKKAVVSDILLQVDIAQDGKKQGFTEEEILPAVEEIRQFSNVRIHGLMTVAPYVEDPEQNRKIFQRIKQISVDIQAKNYDNVNMNVLSMGMSNDFAVAVEEGATHLRIGTAIFGDRKY